MEVIADIVLVVGSTEAPQEILPGEIADLPDNQANDLIRRGIARSVVNDAFSEADRMEMIVDAIDGLNKDAFGKDGKPNVRALEEFTGFDITAKERDEAWTDYQQLTG